ncbi:MAG TPA: hypothetical protein VMG12_38410 [Polyangiaceae bacterium]|nr:hypothetical protein [Polyangiaceae bacterium]
MTRRARARHSVSLAAVTLAAVACARSEANKTSPAPAAAAAPASPTPAPLPSPAPPSEPPAVTGPLRFLAIGGGPTPESNEVSLEQDIDLVRRALPAPGLVLFAGGSGSPSVRELEPNPKGDPVRTALGDLFAPRSGRQSRYRAPSFAAERATLENVQTRLSSALAEGDGPLLVYIAAHGDQGTDAKSNAVALWGGHALSVSALAELHEHHRRPLRLIATSCFSGGFGELAFAAADASGHHPSPVPRCGLFAGTADRETSGCDPNPNRRAQESYGLHLAHALAGTRRDGSRLEPGVADYDHDGKIGLLDAHTFARIEAVSFDVPTTTSERWLREVEAGSAPIDRRLLPEDAAVIDRLEAAIGTRGEDAVRARWSELDQKLAALEASIDRAEDELTDRVADEATRLLERWPVLDDPYHPEFEATFHEHRAAIEQLLTSSPEARSRAQTDHHLHALYDQLDTISVQEARVLRVTRAYETLHKAAALMKRGGPAAKYYATLLACERAVP